jgi:DNA-binding CsgD family transcriptional regulator/tetratricopeptide (TPR) repeat protein
MGKQARERHPAAAKGGAPLVARDDELAALRELLQAARRSREGRIAVIEGEVGIGKTRLLEEVLGSAEARELYVLRGSADELARERPFGPLVEALDLTPESRDADARELGELILGTTAPNAVRVEAPDVRFRVVEGLVAMIERMAWERPLLLAIEDLHWADPSTLLTLRRMTQRLVHSPLALIGTCRPHPRPAELAALLRALPDDGVHLRLGALETEAARGLAAALLDAEPGRRLAQHLDGTAGNPLFVVELIGALGDEGALRLADGRAEVSEAGLPPTLRLTILRRLSFLPQGVLDTLGAASALGSSFSVDDLALLLERSIPDLLGPLREALDAGVLRGDGDDFRFRHDLVREAVYGDLAAPIRAGLHLQAARALAAAGRPAAQVATHFALGAPAGDRDAVGWLRRGAAETAPRAPAVAARFLRRAVEIAPADDPERLALQVDLARSLLWSGDLAEAERMARELLAEGMDADGAASLHYAIGRALAYQGRLGDAIEHGERALAEGGLTATDRARLLAELSHRRLLSGDVPGAARAADEATAYDDPVARWTALCARAWAAAADGELARASQLAAEAVAIAGPRPADPVARIQPRLYEAFVAIHRDRLGEAEERLRSGLALAEELGATWAPPLHHAGLAVLQWHAGAWDDALAEAETSLALADELDTRVWKPAAYGVVAQVAFHRDDFGRAEDALRETAAEPATLEARFWGGGLAVVRARLADARGHTPAALDVLAEHWPAARRLGPLGDWRETGPEIVRLALVAGRRGLAAEVTRTLESLPAVRELPAAAGAALLCRGMLDGDDVTLRRAEEKLRGGARPLEYARAAEAAGLLREAVRVYEELGATRDAARTDAALRRAGVRRGSRGGRKRPSTGWESLTPSEQRVASLVAEGLTNPQIAERLFLSRRTVETHVSHALRKLELSSRVHLAAEAARREGPQDGRQAPTVPSEARASR